MSEKQHRNILPPGAEKQRSLRSHKEGSRTIKVNGREFNEYFTLISSRNFINQPLQITNNDSRFDINARTVGGGINGQAAALRRAISAFGKNRPVFKGSSERQRFLTRDPRERERKSLDNPAQTVPILKR